MCIAAHDRAGLERLLRYCARPPFALARLRKAGRELGNWHERLKLAEQDKRNAVELAQAQVANQMQKSAVAKDSEIQALKAKLDAGEVARKLAIAEALTGVERERDELMNGLRGTAKRSSRKLAPRMHYVDHLDGSSCDLIADDVVGVSHKFSQALHTLA